MKKRILIIDDEKSILRLYSRILEKENREIHTASSGSEALNLLNNNKFDLILLDLKMPGMDGTKTLREIRKIDQVVSVYIMTAFQNEFLTKLSDIQKDGISFEILDKPVEKAVLLTIAESVFEGAYSPIIFNKGKNDMIRLFITGQNKKLNEDFDRFQDFLNKNTHAHYEFEIIDVLNNPRAADEANVFVTPSIIMGSPLKSKKIVGDISDPEKLASILGLL